MQNRIFYGACFGFVFGILLRSFFQFDFHFSFLFLIVSFSLLLFFIFISRWDWGIVIVVFALCLALGILRLSSAESDHNYIYENGERINLGGKIVDAPDVRENNQKLTIEIDISGLKNKILVTTHLDREFKYGDKVELGGEPELPENFVTEQGKEFDYINYLRKDGILYVMDYPFVELISRGQGNKIKSALFTIKDKFLNSLNVAIQNPENLLMGGLILGERAAFSEELRQRFIDTGTIHIIALSGYNITIVAEWVMKFFKTLPQALGVSLGVLAIFVFILMTGGTSTAVRAGIMATLVLLSRSTGRIYDATRALVLAGVLMIMFNPYVLVYDVSFQLSFIATVAVIFFTPKIEKYFLWVTPKWKLRDVFSVTSAAYIFVLPFVLYKMGNFSIVALPANILILPFIAFTMLLGFLTATLGLISSLFSAPLGYFAYLLLHYELQVVAFFSKVSFASFTIPNFPLTLTVLIYAYFMYLLFGRDMKEFFTAPL